MMPESASLWKRLAQELSRRSAPEGEGIWTALRQRLNPALYRPAQAPAAGSIPLTSRKGEAYFVLSNRARQTYLRLGPPEQHIWSLMDGSRTTKDLVLEYFTKFGVLAFGLVGHLVVSLRHSHMLADPPQNVLLGVRRALSRRRWSYPFRVLWEGMTGQRRLLIRNVDGAITWLYRSGGWVLYSRPMQVVYVLLCVVGGWLFFQHLLSGEFNLFRAGGSYARGLLLLMGLNYLGIAIHELAHALTCKHHGARVNGAGALLFFGMPAYYIDTSDIWTRPAAARIATSWAGPYSGFVLAGLCSILVAVFPDSFVAPTLHRLAFIWILILIFNLIPLIELDGYFMLIDWLEIPMLRARALAFIRRDLWTKLRRREPFSGEQRLLGLFGILSFGFSIFAVFLGVQFWRIRLAPVVRELWGGGPGAKALLALLVLVLTMPIVVGLGGRLLLLGRASVRWVRRRWEQPRPWTLRERAALLRQVHFLTPLPADQVTEVARRLERATFRPGDAVIRQGEVGDRFYIIEAGAAEVWVEGEGQPRRTLAPGDYFGELALLYGVPRTATVRAAAPLAVLRLRKGDFERLLAPHVAASARIEEAIQTLERLRGFAIFAGLSSRELDELAARLQFERVAAGTAIVEEGQPGDYFYLINSGQAEAVQGGRRMRIMTTGDHFGEIALLLDVPRTATVRALTPLEVFRLSRADFDTLVGTTLTRLAAMLEEVGRERLTASAGEG